MADLQPSNGQHPSSPFRPNLRGLDTAHGGGITGEHESGHHACHTPIHLALVILTTTQTYFSHQFLPPSSADPGPRCGQTHDGEIAPVSNYKGSMKRTRARCKLLSTREGSAIKREGVIVEEGRGEHGCGVGCLGGNGGTLHTLEDVTGAV